MNLLKQTALILGLASLSIAAWTLYRSWRKKIAIEFSITCLVISIWSLSFVAYATLHSRLSYDVHRFFNIWLVPIGVRLLARLLTHEDYFSRFLKSLSWVGSIILSLMVVFSVQSFYESSSLFAYVVKFWPTVIFIEFFNVVFQDAVLKRSVSLEFISTKNRVLLYIGTALALATCTFDHIPELGLTIPSIANLLFTAFLAFASQVIFPQKFLRVEALVSRFFAVLTLSLLITGFFALLYQYVSGSFPLFLLNSFLLSFAMLIWWTPLVSFFRHIGVRFSKREGLISGIELERFKSILVSVTDLPMLQKQITEFFKKWIDAEDVSFMVVGEFSLPPEVERFFLRTERHRETPILHRQLIQLEIDQELTRESRQELRGLRRFLNDQACDMVFPILHGDTVRALVLVKSHTTPEDTPEDWSFGFANYTQIYRAIQDVGAVVARLSQIEEAKEKEKLVILGEMAAGLAHEVRNPLGAIGGAADLLDENASPWVKVIKEEVQRLNRLVGQFLDLSHVPSAQAEECDLIAILSTSLSYLKPTTPIPIYFHSMLDEAMVKAVPDHLQQIIINLVQNAVQSSTDKIEVHVLKISKDHREWVGFEVVDFGVGIPEEQFHKVFQPFFTSFKNGTGLGLSICERLVKLNGGFMELNSRVQHGTTVKVYLPYAR